MRNTVKINKNNDALNVSVATENLLIRSMSMNDEKDYVALLTNPENMKTFGTGEAFAQDFVKERLAIRIKLAEKDPFNLYAVLEKKSEKFVGFGSFTRQVDGKDEVEVGCVIDRPYQNKGYGRETVKAIFDSLIPELWARGYKIDKFIATALINNEASQKMLTKVGFKQEGTKFAHGDLRYYYSLSTQGLFGQERKPAKGVETSFISAFQSKL